MGAFFKKKKKNKITRGNEEFFNTSSHRQAAELQARSWELQSVHNFDLYNLNFLKTCACVYMCDMCIEFVKIQFYQTSWNLKY